MMLFSLPLIIGIFLHKFAIICSKQRGSCCLSSIIEYCCTAVLKMYHTKLLYAQSLQWKTCHDYLGLHLLQLLGALQCKFYHFFHHFYTFSSESFCWNQRIFQLETMFHSDSMWEICSSLTAMGRAHGAVIWNDLVLQFKPLLAGCSIGHRTLWGCNLSLVNLTQDMPTHLKSTECLPEKKKRNLPPTLQVESEGGRWFVFVIFTVLLVISHSVWVKLQNMETSFLVQYSTPNLTLWQSGSADGILHAQPPWICRVL